MSLDTSIMQLPQQTAPLAPPLGVPSQIALQAPVTPKQADIEAIYRMAQIVAYSGFINTNASRGDIEQRKADAFFVMEYGRELGIQPMTALKTIFVIDGKPSTSGQAMLSIMYRAGVQFKLPDPGTISNEAKIEIKRPGHDTWTTYTYTWEMATNAGLVGKGNWKKYPREMMLWRVISTAARFEASDIIGGLYTFEELSPDTPVNELGEPVSTIRPTSRISTASTTTTPSTSVEVDNWPTTAKLDELFNRFRDGIAKDPGVTNNEISRILNIDDAYDLSATGWGQYATRNDAATALKEAWIKPATPQKQAPVEEDPEIPPITTPAPEPPRPTTNTTLPPPLPIQEPDNDLSTLNTIDRDFLEQEWRDYGTDIPFSEVLQRFDHFDGTSREDASKKLHQFIAERLPRLTTRTLRYHKQGSGQYVELVVNPKAFMYPVIVRIYDIETLRKLKVGEEVHHRPWEQFLNELPQYAGEEFTLPFTLEVVAARYTKHHENATFIARDIQDGPAVRLHMVSDVPF